MDVTSPAGAQGVAQFMPGTAAERGLVNPYDPEQAIPKAAELLADFKIQFGNLGLAAAAYNGGPTRVANWIAGVGGLPEETRNFVLNVTGHVVEDWIAGATADKAGDAALPKTSCPEEVAVVRTTQPDAAVLSTLTAPWGVQIAGSFSKAAGRLPISARVRTMPVSARQSRTDGLGGSPQKPRLRSVLSRARAGGYAGRRQCAVHQNPTRRRRLRRPAQLRTCGQSDPANRR